MADRRSIIGQVHNDQHRGPRTTGFHGSENGDGYLSDVQTLNSNNPSEVSQDFHSSARLLEQLFNDKCNFIRDSYDQRSRQLSDVVNKLCEDLVSDEVLQEMRSDRTSSAYIPAHLGEVIHRHLEDNREQFIHRLITQLSEARSGLVKLKDQAIQRNKFIDSLEPEIIRGKKALSGMDGLQRQLTDMKRQYDNLQHHSQEKIRKLKVINDQLCQKDNQSGEQVQKLQVELSMKSQAVESLQKDVDEKTRDSCFMESSYDRAVNDEVSMRILSISTEKMELSVQLGELKSELKLKSDQLVRSQDVLKIKEEEDYKNKSQTASMISQVQIILDQESNESNRTIAALYDKMKIFKSKLSLELQQEKNLTTVLKNEMTVVRIEKDEKVKQFQKALIDIQNHKEKMSILVKESSALQLRYQECQTALRNSELDSNKAQSQIQYLQQELDFSIKLKEQELSVAFSKAKMQAVKELEHDRLQLDQEVLKRTESYIKNNENQLKVLHNQLRHSYSFGTATSNSTSQNISNNNNNNQSVVWGTAGNTALDLSVLVALKSAEDKANISKIVLESEFLISKTKSDAKMENIHREKVQKLEFKLLEASDNISKLKGMVLAGRKKEEENNDNKDKMVKFQNEAILLTSNLEKINSDLLLSEKKLITFENERILEKQSFFDLQKKLNDVLKMHNDYENLETIESRIKVEKRNIEVEKDKLNREKLLFHESQIRFEIEKTKTVNIVKNDHQIGINNGYGNHDDDVTNRKFKKIEDENENEILSPSIKDKQRFRYGESDIFEDKMTSLKSELFEVKNVLKNLQEEYSKDKNNIDNKIIIKMNNDNDNGRDKERENEIFLENEEEKEKEKEDEKQRILFENYQRLYIDFDDNNENTEIKNFTDLKNICAQDRIYDKKTSEVNDNVGWDFHGSGYISPDDTEYFHEREYKNKKDYTNNNNRNRHKIDTFDDDQISEKIKNRLKNDTYNYLYEEDNELKLKKEQEQIKEIQELKLLLLASKNQAIFDQKQDAYALEIMSQRFNNLMLNYEKNVTAVSEKLDSSHAQTIQSEDLLVIQTETIRFLEDEILQKNVIADSKNLLISELTRKNLHLLNCIKKLNGICNKQFTDLKAKLRKTRESVEDFDPFIDNEFRNTISSLTKMSEILQNKNNQKHENDIRKLRETLDQNHRNEQESNTTFYVKRFQIQSDENIKKLIKLEKENEKLRDISKNNDSLGNSAHHAVCMGLLDALECTGLFSNAQVGKILFLINENLEPDSVISNIVKEILAEKLNILFLEMKEFKSEVEHLRKELIFNSSGVPEVEVEVGLREADGGNEDGKKEDVVQEEVGNKNENESKEEYKKEDGRISGIENNDEDDVDDDEESMLFMHDDIPVQREAENDNDEKGVEVEVEDIERRVEEDHNRHHREEREEGEEGGMGDESLVNISLNSLRS